MNILKVDGFENIFEVDCFRKEFLKSVNEKPKKPGKKARYQDWLFDKITRLNELGMKALKLPQFEELKDLHPKLYSIRYPHSKKNTRVVYIYIRGNQSILLTAFNESNKSDYDIGTDRARERLKHLKEG